MENIPITEADLLRLQDGDMLHVKVGLSADELGGQPPWIPGPEELDAVRDDLAAAVPPGVRVIVTHFGIDLTVVREEDIDG